MQPERVTSPENAEYQNRKNLKFKVMYKLQDTQTGNIVGTYKSVKVARNARDRKNFEYGAVRYVVRINN